MKAKNKWHDGVFCLILTMGACFLPVGGFATGDDECAKEILLAYYPGIFVEETLGKFNVPKEEWPAIVKELGERDKQIIKQVESKASQMTSNPLKDPQQRQAAVKLFRDTLLENFAEVMRAHGVNDDKQIQAMLDDIQQQKAKRFARCIEKQRQLPMPAPKPALPTPTKGSS